MAENGAPIGDEARSIEIGALLDGAALGARQIWLLVLCFLIVAIDGFNTQAIAFVSVDFKAMLHLTPADIGIVFSISTAGGVIGGLLVGPLADRTGRRPWIVFSTLGFGLLTFLYVGVTALWQLLILRAILGFVLALTISVTYGYAAEIVPKRFVARSVVFVTLGYSVGVAVGGLLASYLLPAWGWRSVFVSAGASAVLLAAVAYVALPETLRFLLSSGAQAERVRQAIRRSYPAVELADDAVFHIEEEHRAGLAFRNIFAEGRLGITLPLWLCVLFLNMVLWVMTQWLPLLVTGMGGDIRVAAQSIAIFTIGGIVGSLVFATAIDRSPRSVALLVGAFLLAALSLYGLSRALSVGAGFLLLVSVCGFVVKGGQYALNGLAANIYPTYVRATGMAVYTAVARLGAMLGPLLIGFVLSAHSDARLVFGLGVVPAIISAIATAMLSRRLQRRAPA